MDDPDYDDDPAYDELWEPLSPGFQARVCETVSRALAERRWNLLCERLLHKLYP